MAYYVYKCNLKPVNGPDTGDWMEWVFARTDDGEWEYDAGVTWGAYAAHPELAKLERGDLVIALQTGNRKTLVGIAEYVRDAGKGAQRSVVLRPRELINAKIPPLKKADPKGIGSIKALAGGDVKTLYDITTSDAKKLLAAARLAKEQSVRNSVNQVSAKVLSVDEKVGAVGAGFGDSETNRKVERAAVAAVTRKLEDEGWTVISVEQAKLGYDLRCTRGKARRFVEIKGIQGTKTGFFITAAEVRKWQDKASPSEVAVVTSALTKPRITIFRREDEKRFVLEQVLLRARLKP
jgi:hypothetical protein